MGLIRKTLNVTSVGFVSSSSRKQRVAAATLAAEQRQAAALEALVAPPEFTDVELQHARVSLVQRRGQLRGMTAGYAQLRDEARRLRDLDRGASSG